MNKLTEGSLHEELQETVLPFITVDEFEPKSGQTDEVIVVAFYLIDEEPANDLSQFLEKSVFDTLDTEVSPNPNEDGYYLVFVEIERNEQFFDTFVNIVKDVENVSGKLDWKISTYLSDDTHSIDDPALPRNISFSQQGNTLDESQITEYFNESWLSTLTVDKQDNTINVKLGSGTVTKVFEVHGFDEMSTIVEEYDLANQPIDLFYESTELRFLKDVLGNNCSVNFLNGYYVVDKESSNKIMLLK